MLASVALLAVACGGVTPSASDAVASASAPGTTSAPTSPTAAATSSAGTTTTPATPTPTAEDPTPTPRPRAVAGEILRVPNPEAFVDDRPAAGGDRLLERSVLRTDAEGTIQFRLRQKIEQCQLFAESTVRVRPSDPVLFRLEAGQIVCNTTADAMTARIRAGDDTVLDLSDPGFVIATGPNGTVVRVVSGLVEVRSRATGGSVLLGPTLRSDVPAGGGPADPFHWGTGELEDDLVRDAVNELENLPGPDLSRPPVRGSPVLRRIRDTGAMRIGRDAQYLPDPDAEEGPDGVAAFVTDFFEQQGVRWEVRDEPVSIPSEDAPRALAAGEIDVFVSPARLDGLARIPLVDAPEGERFFVLVDPSDERFVDAQRAFVRGMVIEGGYGSSYERSFDVDAARYDAVAGLLGL